MCNQPTEWTDLSKAEIITRKDAVIKQLTKQIGEMDKEAKARARRCVEHFDKESDIKCFISEDSTAADLLHCTDVNSKADAYRDAAKLIRREFDIEEKKSEEENNNGKDANKKR